jgi:hypothetical protein
MQYVGTHDHHTTRWHLAVHNFMLVDVLKHFVTWDEAKAMRTRGDF